jgi:hypothetical protein
MLFRTLLFATLTSYAFAAVLSDRAKPGVVCSSCVVQTLTTGGKTITTTITGTGATAATTSSTSSSSSGASTLTMTATETSGTWAPNFQASATAAAVTCGQFYVPTAAVTCALSHLKTTCSNAVIPAGGYCSESCVEENDTRGVYAFLCNKGTLPMTAKTLDDPAAGDASTQNNTLYYSHMQNACPGEPAALGIAGQWLYAYVDWDSAKNIGTDQLCSYPFADIRGYPSKLGMM